MLNKMLLILIGCFVMLCPLLSFGFDCNHPDFGATLQELNKDGYFVKYMEKGGVSYYNYTGTCQMETHSVTNPAISYAFIDDKLYARIMHVPQGIEGDPEKVRMDFEQRISNFIGTSEMQKKQDGDWLVYQWVNEKEKTKFKIKVHSKTFEGKGAWYYEPLREALKAKSQAIDPVDKIE